MKQRGFTLIEIMIAIVVVAIIIMGAIPILTGTPISANTNSISYGINGMTESRCIEGYKFILGEHGQARQILDEFGKGVRCQDGIIVK